MALLTIDKNMRFLTINPAKHVANLEAENCDLIVENDNLKNALILALDAILDTLDRLADAADRIIDVLPKEDA